MYQTHFRFQSQPFSEHAPPATLWVDERMQEGLARLGHLVEHATLGLVTGPTGVGKSALLKRFLYELSFAGLAFWGLRAATTVVAP